MAKFFKWLAIILGVLLLACVVLTVFAGMFRFGGMGRGMWGGMPMMGRGFPEPFMGRGRGMMFMPMMLFRMLIPVGFLALLFVAGFFVGKATVKPQPQPAALVPTPAPVAAVSSPALCPNCGRAVQVDWNICPNCGANQKGSEPPSAQGMSS